MASAAHLLRRNAVYYWRRKVPRALAACENQSHFLISLRTWSPAQARSLAIQLDAFLDDTIRMPEANLLNQVQLDGMLRDVLTQHLAKLERVAAAAKLSRGFDRRQAERDDQRAAWVYRMLDAQGPTPTSATRTGRQSSQKASTRPTSGPSSTTWRCFRKRSRADETPYPRPLLEAQNTGPTAMNLAQAQQVYFRGMRLALQQYPARYRAQPIDDDALFAGLIQAEVGQRAAAVADRVMSRTDQGHAPRMDPLEAGKPAAATSAPSPASASSGDTPIGALGDKLRLKRHKEGAWDSKTARQATRLYTLFDRFLAQECGIHALEALRQTHLVQFINFIQFEVYTH